MSYPFHASSFISLIWWGNSKLFMYHINETAIILKGNSYEMLTYLTSSALGAPPFLQRSLFLFSLIKIVSQEIMSFHELSYHLQFKNWDNFLDSLISM